MKHKKCSNCYNCYNTFTDAINALCMYLEIGLDDEPEEEPKKEPEPEKKCGCKAECETVRQEDKPKKEDLSLSSPWVQYVFALRAFFCEDPDIDFEFDEEENKVTMRVEGQEKADALTQLLPAEKEFGNVKLTITVVPANKNANSKASLISAALNGNPILSFIRTVEGVTSNPMTFVVFVKEVVQYFNDNLGDIYGNRNTLYQELAKEIFGNLDGIFFGTDVETEID